jgi:hypothetical protein
LEVVVSIDARATPAVDDEGESGVRTTKRPYVHDY